MEPFVSLGAGGYGDFFSVLFRESVILFKGTSILFLKKPTGNRELIWSLF